MNWLKVGEKIINKYREENSLSICDFESSKILCIKNLNRLDGKKFRNKLFINTAFSFFDSLKNKLFLSAKISNYDCYLQK